ncbi:MAG: hypothetical protein MJ141_05780, partial [Clostridia bacterium]|nr:hypothetical protein [Clostridia bacterium]
MKKKKELYRALESETFDGALYLPYEPEDPGERFPAIYILGSEEGEIRSIVSFFKTLPGWKE